METIIIIFIRIMGEWPLGRLNFIPLSVALLCNPFSKSQHECHRYPKEPNFTIQTCPLPPPPQLLRVDMWAHDKPQTIKGIDELLQDLQRYSTISFRQDVNAQGEEHARLGRRQWRPHTRRVRTNEVLLQFAGNEMQNHSIGETGCRIVSWARANVSGSGF